MRRKTRKRREGEGGLMTSEGIKEDIERKRGKKKKKDVRRKRKLREIAVAG